MKSLFELTGTHINKKITVQVPRKYEKGAGYDAERLLSDHNVEALICAGNGYCTVQECEIGYNVCDVENPELTITDI